MYTADCILHRKIFSSKEGRAMPDKKIFLAGSALEKARNQAAQRQAAKEIAEQQCKLLCLFAFLRLTAALVQVSSHDASHEEDDSQSSLTEQSADDDDDDDRSQRIAAKSQERALSDDNDDDRAQQVPAKSRKRALSVYTDEDDDDHAQQVPVKSCKQALSVDVDEEEDIPVVKLVKARKSKRQQGKKRRL
jgi:hypothetical protein